MNTKPMTRTSPPTRKACIVTGPTSGIGYRAALALARHGTVVLVGRNREKLDAVCTAIERQNGHAVSVVCDLSDMQSVKRAAAAIIALRLPIVGLLNNAGTMPMTAVKSAEGWDMTFATNYLGPFLLTEILAPHLPDRTRIVFVVSAVEDPERKPARAVGMRGGRYISAEASARGEWRAGGSSLPGADAYATSKQALLAAALAFARAAPRLRFYAVEPGIIPGTGLGGDANALLRFVFGQIISRLPPFARYRSTPDRAARVIVQILTGVSNETGIYYDERGRPMQASAQVRDRAFQDRVLAETRDFLMKC